MNNVSKISALLIGLVIALGFSGIAYAHWQETLYIDGTVYSGELDWEYWDEYKENNIDPTFTQDDHGIDPDWDKDVASTTGTFSDTDGDGDPDTMTITINNAYPQYHNHISFWVHCNGNIPLKIWKAEILDNNDNVIATLDCYNPSPGWVPLDLDGTIDPDIEIKIGNGWGTQMHFCDEHDFSFSIKVMQTAPEDAILTFSIQLVAIQYNLYSDYVSP